MNSDAEQEEKIWSRLRRLIICRIIVVSIFLIVTVFWGTLKPVISGLSERLFLVYAVIIVMYLLSCGYYILLRSRKYIRFNINLQLIVDIGLVSLLVHLTGGIASNYSLLYILIIIYSTIFVDRRGVLIIASISSLTFTAILVLEYYHIYFLVYPAAFSYYFEAEDVMVRIAVQVLSFFVVAFLASFVVEQEKKTRILLEEKETAFNQLDLLFRSIIESVDTGVLTTNLQGKIKTFNRAAETITAYQLSELENRHILGIFPELDIFFEETGHESVRNRREIMVTNRKGIQIHLGCSISSLKNKHGKQIGHILIFQDLTEIKRMEENLEKSKRLALIGEMAAGLAHEMRNPLASITGSIQLLSQTARIEETDKRLMQIIMRGKDQLDHFVRDFLLLARPIPENREPVYIREIAEEVMETIKLSNDWTQDIRIASTVSGNNKIIANKDQIRQMIQNLLMNALQALTREGNISVTVRNTAPEGGMESVEIQVSDDGCGIEEQDLKNVFEPFFTNKEKGTGLGLTIVNRIVDGYGGKIKIESQINHGTTVTVWLPVAKV
jgi:two-component system, NtrC family, sensor histidine kinase PilS